MDLIGPDTIRVYRSILAPMNKYEYISQFNVQCTGYFEERIRKCGVEKYYGGPRIYFYAN